MVFFDTIGPDPPQVMTTVDSRSLPSAYDWPGPSCMKGVMSTDKETRVLFHQERQPRIRRVRIEVRRGPDKGQRHEIETDPIRIGTAEGCQVRLSDPAISGVHMELRRTPSGLAVRDLGSTNGTFLDGHRILGI